MTAPGENSVFSLPVILSVHFDDNVRDYILARIKTKKGKKRKQQQQKRFSVFPQGILCKILYSGQYLPDLLN